MAKAAGKKRVTIIPAIHGKLACDHKVCEPDIAWIIEKWLDRHPEVRRRRRQIRALSGRWTTEDGLRTEGVTVSIIAGDDIAGYKFEDDADIYEYWKARIATIIFPVAEGWLSPMALSDSAPGAFVGGSRLQR